MKTHVVLAVQVFACLLTGTPAQQEGGYCNSQVENRFKPDPNSCSYFYQCQGDRWVQFRCVTGLVFNNATQICDFPKDYTACPTPAGDTSQLIRIQQNDMCVMPCAVNFDVVYPKLTPSTIDCARFYVCKGGELYEGSCQGNVGAGFTTYETFSRSCSRRVDDWNFNCQNARNLVNLGKRRRRRR